MVDPESRATTSSRPVPTRGASARTSGTAWRCMLEPISARLASSFSRNGISAAATETRLLGRHVDHVDLLARRHHELALVAARHEVVGEAALAVERGVGLGDGVAAFLAGGHVLHPVRHPPVLDPPVGALDKAVLVHPREGGEAVDEAILGPSGVSTGQMRP